MNNSELGIPRIKRILHTDRRAEPSSQAINMKLVSTDVTAVYRKEWINQGRRNHCVKGQYHSISLVSNTFGLLIFKDLASPSMTIKNKPSIITSRLKLNTKDEDDDLDSGQKETDTLPKGTKMVRVRMVYLK